MLCTLNQVRPIRQISRPPGAVRREGVGNFEERLRCSTWSTVRVELYQKLRLMGILISGTTFETLASEDLSVTRFSRIFPSNQPFGHCHRLRLAPSNRCCRLRRHFFAASIHGANLPEARVAVVFESAQHGRRPDSIFGRRFAGEKSMLTGQKRSETEVATPIPPKRPAVTLRALPPCIATSKTLFKERLGFQ